MITGMRNPCDAKLASTRRGPPSLWIAAGVALCVLAPVLALIGVAVSGATDHWVNLLQNVIPVSLLNTATLLLGVGILTGLIGCGSAWLTTAYLFPTRNIITWGLLLPLAVPTYIIAFAYLDVLHPLGPIQTWIRSLLGYASPRDFRLPDLRSMAGAIFLLGLVLYPYVYLSVRVMFMTQAASLLEAARTLGCSRRKAFWRIVVPLARPAMAVGITLVLLETLNDIGASEFLGIQTMTISIYTTWITRSNLQGAAQIAIIMLAVVTLLIYLERYARRRQRYAVTQRMRPLQPVRLTGVPAIIAILLGWFPIVAGFVVPFWFLVSESVKRLSSLHAVSTELLKATYNTLAVSLTATAVTLALGLTIAWSARYARISMARVLARCSSLGYAIPGTVLAIGLLVPYSWVDRLISYVLSALAGIPPQLYIMGSTAGIICAYTLRFMAISVGSVESGLARIPPSLEQASRSLGHSAFQTFIRVHLPLLRPALGAAALLIFVDAMKELSATLLLRPLNFETLSTWLYAEAARGTYDEGAIAALIIVFAGLIPVIILARTQLKANY